MLVYVGAVMVLFLFVVMMLDINVDALRDGFWRHFPLAALVGVVIALEMAAVLLGGFRLDECARRRMRSRAGSATPSCSASRSTRDYLYPLQIAAVLLLVAIIAAIALTLRRRKDFRSQVQEVRRSQQVDAAPRQGRVALRADACQDASPTGRRRAESADRAARPRRAGGARHAAGTAGLRGGERTRSS